MTFTWIELKFFMIYVCSSCSVKGDKIPCNGLNRCLLSILTEPHATPAWWSCICAHVCLLHLDVHKELTDRTDYQVIKRFLFFSSQKKICVRRVMFGVYFCVSLVWNRLCALMLGLASGVNGMKYFKWVMSHIQVHISLLNCFCVRI